MKILIFNWRDIHNPLSGGSEIYFHEIAKRWVMKGNEVTMICANFDGGKNQEIIDGIKIIRSGREFTQYILAPITYWRLKEKPDIIIDVENGIPFFSPLFSRKKKVLHIHHLHKSVWFKEKPIYLAIIGRILESFIMPLIYAKIPLTTISKSSSEEIMKEKITSKIPKIISPGIDFVKFKKVEKSKTPTILFLNRIKKYKGIKTYLDVAKMFEIKKRVGEFWVVGSGELLNEMKVYVMKNKNVKFFGRVSDEKKHELMQKAWVFVNPSFKEGWGIVNIEANYFGTPVVGSNVDGIKDSVIDNKTGLLFKYGDANDLAKKIEKLLDRPDLREKFSVSGKSWAKKFSWDSAAEKFLKVLEKELKLFLS